MEPPSEPPRNLQNSPVRRQIRNQRGKRRRRHPSGLSGIMCEAVPVLAQFKLRTPDIFAWSAVQSRNACDLKSTLTDVLS
eukprot:14855633-Alexandrium_andersonii.AAC.1